MKGDAPFPKDNLAAICKRKKGFQMKHAKTVFAFAGAMLVATRVLALTETVNGIRWTFTVSNGVASVGGGSSSSQAIPRLAHGAIAIPSTLGGYPVVTIGEYAFGWCTKITEVSIPETVTKISGAALYASSVRKIKLGNCTTKFEDGAGSISSDSFTEFTVSESNPRYSVRDGVLFSQDMKTLDVFPTGKAGEYHVPNGVANISEYAFGWCQKVSGIVVPDSVTNVCDTAFYACSATAIYLPEHFRGKTARLIVPDGCAIYFGQYDGNNGTALDGGME